MVLASGPFIWSVVAWMQIARGPWAPEWSPSSGDRNVALLLSAFSIPALVPAAIAAMLAVYALGGYCYESVPNRSSTAERFEDVFGSRPDESVRLFYETRRFVVDCNFCETYDERDLLKFSVRDAATASRLLNGAGFTSPAMTPSEPFYPRDFPLAWRPISLGSDLETWRSARSVAWFDWRNLAVYVSTPVDYSRSSVPISPGRALDHGSPGWRASSR